MEEVWKKIENYEDYEVSTCGNVRSNKKGKVKMLKPTKWWSQSTNKREEKYLGVTLQQNGVRRCFSVHRLVASAFLENPNKYSNINHKNGIKDDNRVDNLEWCSHRANVLHSIYVLQNKRIYKDQICQYDKSGSLIHVFNNVREAVQSTGINHGNILHCANHKRSVAGGFIWRFMGDESDILYNNKTQTKVVALSLCGEFLKTFDSIVEAAQWANVDTRAINSAVSGITHKAGKYMWRYFNSYNKDEFSIFNGRKIIECTTNGTPIKEYQNIRELIEKTHFDAIKIKNVIIGKQQSAYRRKWKVI